MNTIKFIYIETNGVILHTAVAGPVQGPLVILLHGFPEFWYGWRHQIEPLAKAGYRVAVPDQRGYNLSQKPSEIENYRIDHLKDDIIGIINFFGREKATLIGHDWGGLVAWHLASSQPQYVEKLMVVNCPHPAVMTRLFNYFPFQWIKSLYLLFFQIPLLPEKIFRANQYKLFRKILEQTSKKDTFEKEELNKYQASWAQTEAITSMLNWYRALQKGTIDQIESSSISMPVQIIWGTRDSFLSLQLARESAKFCRNVSLVLVDATHWIHLEQPRLINNLLMEFLSEE